MKDTIRGPAGTWRTLYVSGDTGRSWPPAFRLRRLSCSCPLHGHSVVTEDPSIWRPAKFRLDGSNRYVRRLFVSRADGAVIYEIGSEECANEEVHPGDRKGTGKHIEDQAGVSHCISGEIGLTLYPSDRWGDTPEFKELAESVVTSAKGAYIRYAGRNDDGTDFGAVSCGLFVKTEVCRQLRKERCWSLLGPGGRLYW